MLELELRSREGERGLSRGPGGAPPAALARGVCFSEGELGARGRVGVFSSRGLSGGERGDPRGGGFTRLLRSFGGRRVEVTVREHIVHVLLREHGARSPQQGRMHWAPVDEGPPVRIELLPGAPLSVHAVDRTGTRTTSIHGADLRTFLLFEDGSRTATGLPHQSTAGVWRFGFDDDPLGLALTAGVTVSVGDEALPLSQLPRVVANGLARAGYRDVQARLVGDALRVSAHTPLQQLTAGLLRWEGEGEAVESVVDDASQSVRAGTSAGSNSCCSSAHGWRSP